MSIILVSSFFCIPFPILNSLIGICEIKHDMILTGLMINDCVSSANHMRDAQLDKFVSSWKKNPPK